MKNNLSFTGVIKKIMPISEITAKSEKVYHKMSMILEETDVQYPATICIEELVADGTELKMSNLSEGQQITAHFNTRATVFSGAKGEFINQSNSLWKYEVVGASSPAQASPPPAPSTTATTDSADDLPF